MRKNIQISIPTPCHENWQDMKPVERGRFCDSCQKKVRDFTASPDKVIMEVFAKDSRLCGRFRVDQLERNLVVPKEKNSIWLAAGFALLGFLSLGSNETKAQEPAPSEQTQPPAERPEQKIIGPRTVTGKVTAMDSGLGLELAGISNKTAHTFALSDTDGNFSIQASLGDTIEVYLIGYETLTIVFDGDNLTALQLEKDSDPPYITLGGAIMGAEIKPSEGNVPANRAYHSIWDIFR